MLSNQVVVISNQVLQVMVIVTDDFDTLTLLPPPERCVSHRTPSNGEGGGRSGGLKGHGDRTGGLQSGARSGTQGGVGSSGGHGGSGDSGDHGVAERLGGHGGSGNSGRHGGAERLGGHGGSEDTGSHGGSGDSVALALGLATQAMAIWPPKKKFLGKFPSGSSSGGTGSVGHSGSMDTWGRSGSADTWGRSWGRQCLHRAIIGYDRL